jgi:hypothetical protein
MVYDFANRNSHSLKPKAAAADTLFLLENYFYFLIMSYLASILSRSAMLPFLKRRPPFLIALSRDANVPIPSAAFF